MKNRTWLLVCDASRAHLLEEKEENQFSHLESFEHAESRAKVRDLMADQNGRKPDGKVGGSSGHRPGAAPDTDPKEVEAQKFARELAQRLEKGLDDHAYDALILAAPPHFLGLLRGELGDQVSKRVEASIDKDYVSLETRELGKRIQDQRAAKAA